MGKYNFSFGVGTIVPTIKPKFLNEINTKDVANFIQENQHGFYQAISCEGFNIIFSHKEYVFNYAYLSIRIQIDRHLRELFK